MVDLKNLDLTLDTIDLFVDCFRANGISLDPESVKWLYICNDTSRCVVNIAYDFTKSRVAGIYALTCLRFKVFDSQVLGATSIDTITDKNYRRQGLFYRLALDVYDRALAQGISIVHGFPNKNSVQGYRNKINYRMQDPIPFLIRPLKARLSKYAQWLPDINFPVRKHKSPFVFIEDGSGFPLDVNEIWRKFSEDIGVAVIRDKSFLEWRFCRKPNGGYRILHCRNTEGEYLGFIVFLIRPNSSGGYNSYIMDLMYPPSLPLVGKALLDYAVSEISREKVDFVMCLCYPHSPNFNIFRSRLFFRMPRFLAPSDNHFGYKVLDSSLERRIKRQDWYLSYADSDTV